MTQRTCAMDGCTTAHYARGVCKRHYRHLPDQAAKASQYDTRKRQAPEYQARERRRNQGRRDYQQAWANGRKDWAAWWERQRLAEDRAEIRTWRPKAWPHCRLSDRPTKRSFVAGRCAACAAPWLYYAKRAQSPYCATCAAIRRQRPGGWRAQRHGAKREPIIPRRIFERDRWRCQICGCKTTGNVPSLKAPTLDHIVPLSQGGDHTYANLQCACFRCNCMVKRDGAVDDQLRPIG